MSTAASIPDDVLARAARVRLACFDVDGTLTDGRLYFDSEGRETKAFHVHDGQGLVLLRKSGIAVALITARKGGIVERRAAELGVQAHVDVGDKLERVRALCATQEIALDEVAFMGDDMPDLVALRAVGLAAAPADAQGCVDAAIHWRARAAGGRGAAREFCDLILQAQGRLDRIHADGRVS
ncbi:phenylphosphate carboxylase subunit delta [Luteimonas sp. BDR2-5]|uniref:KdsC family phosphatase n=1 Tax=Proluteimonas luteida TaxID=2878685 RepID=UPI001E65CFD0|nr:phenylphosphate carboxylase subunit delta [Luteimonas sp. BDR2-5]MCD9029269.1 phenylphosphate carboxylase subunit delta [Luteimonas sp. BDR2-5]